jgi:diguanylate cyclase (GGDEF)-like protein
MPPSASKLEAPGCLSMRIDLIRSSSELAGTLEGCLDTQTLHEFLQPPVGDFRGLRMMLSDASGRVHAASGARAETRIGAELPMASLLYPGSQQLADYADEVGNRLVGSIAPLRRTGWYLVAEAEHAQAFAPAIAITNQIFIVDVCIILLFSVLAYKITLAIMQPIEALSEGAKRIAAGQVDHQIPLPANNDDELGLLTRTFNDMMRKLRSNQLEIEEDRIRLAEKNEELQRANEILAQLSITDGLTKLHNHRYFQDHLTREIKRVSRTRAPLSMILLDIDDFKQLNDVHGHAAGDEVLVALAAIMNDSARESDLIARYGGEEFVILMPNTDLAGAVHLAEKIRMAVETTRLIIGDTMKPIDITISLGVAVYEGNRREFFAEADRALYQAKAHGKNCVIIAGSEPPESPEPA